MYHLADGCNCTKKGDCGNMLSAKAKAFSIDSLLAEKANVKKEENGNGFFKDIIRPTFDICHRENPTKKHTTSKCFHSAMQSINGISENKSIQVELCQNDLWHAFHNLGTEMIITKTGRRMFPAIRVKLHQLVPCCKYTVSLEFSQIDRQKYRYVYHSSKWMVSGLGDDMIPNQLYRHPDTPTEGSVLETQIVSFERIKLTNNETPKYGQVSLMSMQRFIPRIHIHEIGTDGTIIRHHVTSFPQTSFTAVTAYQNQEITKLKIARNPFAKGFREAGKNRSSLEAMIDTFGSHIPQNHRTEYCSFPIGRGIKRNFGTCHGIRERKEDGLRLLLSGKEMRLQTNTWSDPRLVTDSSQSKVPYLMHLGSVSLPIHVNRPSDNGYNYCSDTGMCNDDDSNSPVQTLQHPLHIDTQVLNDCRPWCSKVAFPISPTCDMRPKYPSSHLMQMYRQSLNKI